jgi:hypothetical protein
MGVDVRRCLVLVVLTSLACGCAAKPVNPCFAITMNEAKSAWSAMAEQPVVLARPVIVLGGIYDPGIAANVIARRIKEIAGDDAPVVHIGFLDTFTFDRSAQKVIDAVEERFPSSTEDATIEVDVIGVSMGGLVSRYAASESFCRQSTRKLTIKRLFTISSPHRGAKLAWIPTLDRRIIDMRYGSAFLKTLNAEAMSYELVAYARLGDQVVGESNAAPPGMTPLWIAPPGGFSHGGAYGDTRILADIARRLRAEEPIATDPSVPLPGTERDAISAELVH